MNSFRTPRRVPLARHNLLADRRRLMASVLGVGLAIMLILLLEGLWSGVKAGVSAYQDNSAADVYVAQPGTHNFLGAVSAIPADTVVDVAADPAVEWAAPVRGFYAILDLHATKAAVFVVGSEPGEPGGVWDLSTGRPPEQDDEVVIGHLLADRHGLALGDTIDVMGRRFEVVGTGPDGFMTSFVFVTHAATDDLLRAPGTTSFVLAGTNDPQGVAERLAPTGLAVLNRAELARADVDLVTRAFSVPTKVMRAIAFAVGSLVIALTTYTAVIDRSREYGIVKALGAGARHLTGIVLRQTMTLAWLGLIAGGLLFLAGRLLIEWWRPQYMILATPGTLGRTIVAAMLMGAVAALLPARRLATLEPATAYGGG